MEVTTGESGPRVEVRRSARRRRTVTAYRERDTIVVLVPQRLSKAQEAAFVREMVAKVLAREARSSPPRGDQALRRRARELSEQYLREPRLPDPRAVSWVRNQQRRWGSCTPSTGTIRLSHRLQAMPSWVADYVLVHELAHLLHPAHDRDFWDLVARYPQAERARGFLEGWDAAGSAPPDASGDGGPADDDAGEVPEADGLW